MSNFINFMQEMYSALLGPFEWPNAAVFVMKRLKVLIKTPFYN